MEPSFNWEEKGIFNPYVLKKKKCFLSLVSSLGKNGTWKIGLATSIDGYQWGKKPNPIHLNNNILHVGNHNLKFINNQFHLWYLTGNTKSEEIYYYISDDGYNWHCPNDSC